MKLIKSFKLRITLIVLCLVVAGGLFGWHYWNRQAQAAQSSSKVDLFFLGDSWTAYPGQSGQTISVCQFPVFSVPFRNFVKGACSSGTYGVAAEGYPIDVGQGYTTEGIVRDRLNARGIPYSQVVKHEYAQAGTLAYQWGSAVPADLHDEGAAFLSGIKADLQDPAVTKPIIWMTLGGNDIFGMADVIRADDDTNWNNTVAEIQTNIEKVVNYLITIRPDVEIVLPSYGNMKVHDGTINTFPQLSAFGFCNQFFAANVNGTMFYATSYGAYEDAARAWAVNQNAINWNADYGYAYAHLTFPVSPFYTIAQKRADSANYANGLASYHNGINTTQGYLQSSSYNAAGAAVNEVTVNKTLQRLEPAWKTIEKNHPNNVKHISVWSTIATDPIQNSVDTQYRSSSRNEFADCIHLNPTGYSYYVDRILNQWLPQSKYLNSR